MTVRLLAFRPLAAVLAFSSIAAAAQRASPLVLISVDGMKPEYVRQAAQHGLKLPVLRAFLTQGAYADGVVGITPTLTFPSHTTIVTGVWPAQHGVLGNTIFDPLGQRPNIWYWDFADIKVPTLYTVADAAGIKTASVGWPVTVNAPIDYNIPYGTQSDRTDKPASAPNRPADILDQIGIHPNPKADYPEADATRTAEAVAILNKFHPGFMLVYLANLDHQEHNHSPFSREANSAVETIDSEIGQIEQAALAVDPHTRIVVVSDHGFVPTAHRTNLNVLLVQAGLIELKRGSKDPSALSWQASAWPAGGSHAVMIQHPDDPVLVARVRAVLERAKADPTNGIETILSHDEIVARGGFPDASFLVDYKDGYIAGTALSGPVTEEAPSSGMHGYLPTHPATRSAFFIEGDGIARGRDLGIIDMRQIAPTLADAMHLQLPAAKQPPLNVR